MSRLLVREGRPQKPLRAGGADRGARSGTRRLVWDRGRVGFGTVYGAAFDLPGLRYRFFLLGPFSGDRHGCGRADRTKYGPLPERIAHIGYESPNVGKHACSGEMQKIQSNIMPETAPIRQLTIGER